MFMALQPMKRQFMRIPIGILIGLELITFGVVTIISRAMPANRLYEWMDRFFPHQLLGFIFIACGAFLLIRPRTTLFPFLMIPAGFVVGVYFFLVLMKPTPESLLFSLINILNFAIQLAGGALESERRA